MTRTEEIDAELERLAAILVEVEDHTGDPSRDVRNLMHRLQDERDNLPRQRDG